jgi:antagonist of KipI
MIEVVAAPPYLTVQDLGRPGYRVHGVPAGGAMDPWALSIANVLAGNAPDAAALEWGLGGGCLRWHEPGAFALGGAAVEASLDGVPVPMHRAQYAAAGSVLTVQRLMTGCFSYVAFHGGIDVPVVLGSRGTYLAGRFGGLEGRGLRSGDRVAIVPGQGPAPPSGLALPAALEPRYDAADCRIISGPHAAQFGAAAWAMLTGSAFRVAPSSDRMGYRLVGPALQYLGAAAPPSEPMCPGAVQVPAGGQPIVLMADAPTVGGYPVIAVVCSADLPIVAQRRAGEELRFRGVSVDDAQRALRRRSVDLHTAAHLAHTATAR